MKTKEEIEILRADALAGDSEAQINLGLAYINGDGVTIDGNNGKEAYKWFELAAKQGNVLGLSAIAMCYREGWGVVRDINKAKEWYEKSAILGNMHAANELGEIYEKEANLDEAFFWYFFGKTEEKAKYNLARCYEQGKGTTKRLHSAYNFYKECKREDIKKRIESIKNNKNLSKYYESLISSLPEKRLEVLRTTYNPVLDTRLVSIDILGNNPFRVLGVYSNATERDIRANRSRIEAMSRVGKTHQYDVDHIIPSNIADNIFTLQNRIQYAKKSAENHIANKVTHYEQELNDWLDAEKSNPDWACIPNRDLNEIQAAVSKINSDIERIKYALFWFCNYTPTDNKAIELLISHKWDEARDLWRQEKNFSARINRALMFFYERNDHYAIDEILHLIRSDFDRTEFVDVITSGRIQLSFDELYAIYVDSLFELPDTEVSIYELTEHNTKKLFYKSGYNYFTSKLFDTITAPLEDRLRVAESQDSNDWEKCTEAFNSVASISLKTIKQLHHFVGEDYYRYKFFCNELALKLLEFGIHYNNDNNEDWNAPSTALRFAKLANDIAVDETLLERCRKNIDIFKNNTNISQTEKAIEVIDDKIKTINGIGVTFADIEKTLKSITAYLDVVRDHSGKDSAIYLNESSRVVNIILNRVIDICNYSKSFFTDSGAAPILKQLQKMDMTSETRQRLDKNIKTLSSHLSAVLGEGAWERVRADQDNKGNNSISNVDTQIKAPKSVRAGDNFLVSITIKGKKERIDSPQTTNLTLVDGPTISYSKTRTYGIQTMLKEEIGYSTTFSYHYRAIKDGTAQISIKNGTDNEKRSTGRSITIQVQEQLPKKKSETKSPKRKRRITLYISLVCLLLTIMAVLAVMLFRQDGFMLTKSTISLLSIGGIFIVSTFLFSYSLWNLEDGHYKQLGIVENLKTVGIAAFLSLFIALMVGWAISALTCWLSPSVIVVGADNSHEKYQLLGKSQGRFLSNNSLYIQNNTNETIFLVGVYYSSRFSNSWNNNSDIIVEIPSNGLTKIDKEPNRYFEVPPHTITYRTRNYSVSSSEKYQWFLLDTQLLNQYIYYDIYHFTHHQ